MGCAECYCSGVSSSCSSSHLYRQEIPMVIFNDLFTLTNHQGNALVEANDLTTDIANNQLSFDFPNGHEETLYWSLPESFVGNQVLSYGGALRFTVRNSNFSGQYVADRDVILNGNDISLIWSRQDQTDEV